MIDDYRHVVCLSKAAKEKDDALKEFLKHRILQSFPVQRMDGTGNFVIRKLFNAFMHRPQQLPDRTINYVMNAYYKQGIERHKSEYSNDRIEMQKFKNEEVFQQVLFRTICDHISGMTDDYAFREYQELYGSDPLRNINVC